MPSLKTAVDFFLDRKQSASLLQISERTLDRYVKAGQLSSSFVNGRVLISESAVKAMMKFQGQSRGQRQHRSVSKRTYSSTAESVAATLNQKRVDKVDNVDNVDMKSLPTSYQGETSFAIYQKLYEEATQRLDEQIKRLEGANYRVGQLEAKVEMFQQHFISLADYQKELRLLKSAEIDTNSRYFQEKMAGNELKLRFQEERFNKQVLTLILLIFLGAQPLLWLFFH